MSDVRLLTTAQMASFAAGGYLRFDGIVPESLNEAFLEEIGHSGEIGDPITHYRKIMASSAIPVVAAGTPLAAAYPAGSALGRILQLPEVAGIVQSLVGTGCVLDHHFLHITFPPALTGKALPSQHTHQDSTIDPRHSFDIQLMYFPHAVTPEMGGTRFVPGSHLRIVSEAAVARYQNILGQQHVVCPAGTLLVMHHGIWHGGGANASDRPRYMFKIRLCPTEPQIRLWDTSDLAAPDQRPIFWTEGRRDPDHLHSILTRREPWFEYDTGRLEFINRIRLWRQLTGDGTFDADYWLTRVENEQSSNHHG